MTLRGDLALISKLINADARVLDLGCGTGDLLANLQAEKNVNGYGLDKDPVNIQVCLSKGVNVIEQDLDAGIGNFADDNFDMVVMTDALQAVRDPRGLLREMLRIGEECVVTFPNFGHWRCRAQLGLKGTCPSRSICLMTGITRPTSICARLKILSVCVSRKISASSNAEWSILNTANIGPSLWLQT